MYDSIVSNRVMLIPSFRSELATSKFEINRYTQTTHLPHYAAVFLEPFPSLLSVSQNISVRPHETFPLLLQRILRYFTVGSFN